MSAPRVRADNQNIALYRGDDYTWEFTITNSAGTAQDYSSASAVKMSIWDQEDGSETWSQSATDAAGGNDWANGVLAFTIADTDSDDIHRDQVYDVQVTDSSGLKITVAYGSVRVVKDLTA